MIHGLLRISCSRNPKTPQIHCYFSVFCGAISHAFSCKHETHDLLTLVSSSYQILSQTTIRNIVLFWKCIYESKRIFAIRFATCRITRNLPQAGPHMICHNRIAASQLIRIACTTPDTSKVPTYCLLLCAIEAGTCDSVKRNEKMRSSETFPPDSHTFSISIIG